MDEAKQTHPLTPDKLFQLMVQSAGKLVLVDKLLPKLKAGDHKVLVFSQMIRVLDILEDYLIQKKYVLSGSTYSCFRFILDRWFFCPHLQ